MGRSGIGGGLAVIWSQVWDSGCRFYLTISWLKEKTGPGGFYFLRLHVQFQEGATLSRGLGILHLSICKLVNSVGSDSGDFLRGEGVGLMLACPLMAGSGERQEGWLKVLPCDWTSVSSFLLLRE